MSNDIKVSVICNVYNHEKYVRDALEGFVKQKTNFAFEVLVHDDASTDKSADIIREYEKKYPDIIKPVYQTENQYSQHKPITKLFNLPRVKGKYVAMCEGDDYWTDCNKLQKQYNSLEKNPDCYFCTHVVERVNEKGLPNGKTYPNFHINTSKLSSPEFLEILSLNGYSFQTSSFFFRTSEWKTYILTPFEFKKCSVGDVPVELYFGQLGNVYFIDSAMSCYRTGVPESWVSRNRKKISTLTKYNREMFVAFKKYDEYTNGKFHRSCVRRMGIYMLQNSIFEKKEIDFFKKDKIKYFKLLKLKWKVCVVVGAVFPGLIKKWYLHRHPEIKE